MEEKTKEEFEAERLAKIMQREKSYDPLCPSQKIRSSFWTKSEASKLKNIDAIEEQQKLSDIDEEDGSGSAEEEDDDKELPVLYYIMERRRDSFSKGYQ